MSQLSVCSCCHKGTLCLFFCLFGGWCVCFFLGGDTLTMKKRISSAFFSRHLENEEQTISEMQKFESEC